MMPFWIAPDKFRIKHHEFLFLKIMGQLKRESKMEGPKKSVKLHRGVQIKPKRKN